MNYTVDKMKDVYTVLAELAVSEGSDIRVFIPEDALILQNRLNLEFLSENLDKLGKTVHFDSSDPAGKELIANFEGAVAADYEGSYDTVEQEAPSSEGFLKKVFSVFPRIDLKFPKLTLPKFAPKFGIFIIIFLVLTGVGGFFGYSRLNNSREARVRITIRSESLARSFPIRVDSSLTEDMDLEEESIIGRQVEYTYTAEEEGEATGERIEGDKAQGEILLYNRTEDAINLSSGTQLNYDDEDLVYVLTEDVSVPAVEYEDPEDPASVMIPGEASAEAEAGDIGSEYNIDSDITLTVSGYRNSQLVAKTDGNFEGGSTRTITVVDEEDIERAIDAVTRNLTDRALEGLGSAVSSGSILIEGSGTVSLGDPDIDVEAGDEVESFVVSRSATAVGLSYSESLLEEIALKVLEEVVTEGYAIYGTDHRVSADVLGSSGDYVLSSSAADLQVTIKTSVVPEIDIEGLKERLAGESLDEAQRILGGMHNIRTYKIDFTFPLPIFRGMPENIENILIEIEEDESGENRSLSENGEDEDNSEEEELTDGE